jgi:hypothetical protein
MIAIAMTTWFEWRGASESQYPQGQPLVGVPYAGLIGLVGPMTAVKPRRPNGHPVTTAAESRAPEQEPGLVPARAQLSARNAAQAPRVRRRASVRRSAPRAVALHALNGRGKI